MKPQTAVTINKVNIATAYTESYTTGIKLHSQKGLLARGFHNKGSLSTLQEVIGKYV